MGLFNMSPWSWPMPDDPKDRLVIVYRDLVWLMNSPYSMLVRKQKYQLAGFVRKDAVIQYDTQYGKPMPWFHGFRVDGGKKLEEFYEPKIRKTPVTGMEKEVTLYESPLMILTARNTTSWAHDDANFTWEISARESEQFELLNNHLNEQRATLQDMQEMVQNYRIIADEMTLIADASTRRVNRMKDKAAFLVKENQDVREQLSGQEKTIRELLAKVRKDEARLGMVDKNAVAAGEFEGKTQLQQFEDAVKAVESSMRLVEEVKSAHKAGMEPEVFEKLLRNIDFQYQSLNASIEKMYQVNRPQQTAVKPSGKEKTVEKESSEP